MKGKIKVVFSILVFSYLSSCSQPVDSKEKINDSSIPLNGKINNQSFSVSNAFAEEKDVNNWNVYIWGQNGSNITTKNSSIFYIYPYIEIVIPKSTTEKIFTVKTFGTIQDGQNEKMVLAWTNNFNFTSFDSGAIKINMIDNKINIIFEECITSDNTSELNGTCIVEMW